MKAAEALKRLDEALALGPWTPCEEDSDGFSEIVDAQHCFVASCPGSEIPAALATLRNALPHLVAVLGASGECSESSVRCDASEDCEECQRYAALDAALANLTEALTDE